ncbi:MAG TPA: dihydrofolate reductase family protein [Acidimicrobiales bacterium]|nr:dihydrofolate reductase family protein [Acidimicrobiales bacterium]
MSGLVQFQASMSLDGYIAGPDDDMDWIFEHVDAAEGADEIMAETGAILAGRRTYEVGRRASRSETSEPYGGGWSGVQLVLTHDPPEDPGVTFLTGDIADAVRTGLAAAGGKNLALFGADVLAQCLARGLVDELVLFVIPVLLGDGVPLFRRGAGDGGAPVRLEQIGSVASASSTALRYRVVR